MSRRGRGRRGERNSNRLQAEHEAPNYCKYIKEFTRNMAIMCQQIQHFRKKMIIYTIKKIQNKNSTMGIKFLLVRLNRKLDCVEGKNRDLKDMPIKFIQVEPNRLIAF